MFLFFWGAKIQLFCSQSTIYEKFLFDFLKNAVGKAAGTYPEVTF